MSPKTKKQGRFKEKVYGTSPSSTGSANLEPSETVKFESKLHTARAGTQTKSHGKDNYAQAAQAQASERWTLSTLDVKPHT